MLLSFDNQTGLEGILEDIRGYLAPGSPALSLPPAAYTSQDLWDLERERIFNRSWFLIAHVDQLAQAGAYVAHSIAGELVIVTRGNDGELHAMSPVCRHRLMTLVNPGVGQTDSLTCPYHGWQYGLDGRLRGAPFMADNKAFNPRDCRLPQFAVAAWNGLVWVNLDEDAEPIRQHLDLAAAEFTGYRLNELVQVESWSQEWRANWKLVSENNHENYHVLGLHQNTLQSIMPGGTRMDVRQYSPWALRTRLPLAVSMQPKSLQLDEIARSHLVSLFTFPASLFVGFVDRIVWLSAIPQTIDRVQIVGGVLTTPELAADTAAIADTREVLLAMINDEDRFGLEGVQLGTGSRFAERGHLSTREQPGLLAFYRNLAAALVDGG